MKSQVPAHLHKPSEMVLCTPFKGREKEHSHKGMASSHTNPNKQISSRKKQGQLHRRLTNLGTDDHKSSFPQVRQLRQGCRTQERKLHHYSHFFSCTSFIKVFVPRIDYDTNFCGILTNLLALHTSLLPPR